MWSNKLASQIVTSTQFILELLKCNQDVQIYIQIYIFLFKILCTLPVSTSCPGPMFSSLKSIKSYLRNTTPEVSYIFKKNLCVFKPYMQYNE